MADAFDLELPEYHYGGLGIRGRGEWDGKENAFFLTSEGVTDRDEANGKPAKWIFMGGGWRAGKPVLPSFAVRKISERPSRCGSTRPSRS